MRRVRFILFAAILSACCAQTEARADCGGRRPACRRAFLPRLQQRLQNRPFVRRIQSLFCRS